MISVITCVWNRENERIQNCIDYLKDQVDEIIVVDYGSDEPIKINNAKIIRYDKNPVFNKSHALNLGIKAAKNKFIMCVDCDMIIPEDVVSDIKNTLIDDATFIINTNVNRINKGDIGNWDKAFPWHKENIGMNRARSSANGGMQVFSKEWVEEIHGYDEQFILLGCMDNDMVNRAVFSEMRIIDVNMPIYHQEHEKKKGDVFGKENEEKVNFITNEKLHYYIEKTNNMIVKNPGPWGEDEPNQDKFISLWTNWDETFPALQDKREKMLQEIKNFIIEKKIPIKKMDVKWK